MNTRTNRAPRHPVLILEPTLQDRDTAAADDAARRYLAKKADATQSATARATRRTHSLTIAVEFGLMFAFLIACGLVASL